MTAQPLLEIRGLRVDYGAGPGAVHAVVDVDLMLRRGEVTLRMRWRSARRALCFVGQVALARAINFRWPIQMFDQ